MKKYILTLGLNDKDTCKPAFSESKAVEMICNLLLQRGFKGASITSGRGFYQMEKTKETVFEDFIKIEFMFVEPQKVIDFAKTKTFADRQDFLSILKKIKSFGYKIYVSEDFEEYLKISF